MKVVFLNLVVLFFCFFSQIDCDLVTGILLGSVIANGSKKTNYIVIPVELSEEMTGKRRSTSTTTTGPTTTTISTTTRPTTTTTTTRPTTITTTTRPTTITTTTTTTSSSTTMSPTTESICGANATYTNCFNECGNQCFDFAVPTVCTLECRGDGCTCSDDYVRDPITNSCVLPSDCHFSPKCPFGQIYYPCGSCPATCQNQNPICPRICRIRGNCDCAQGFVRNHDAKCVPISLCPYKYNGSKNIIHQ